MRPKIHILFTCILSMLLCGIPCPASGQNASYQDLINDLNEARKSRDFAQLASAYINLASYEESINRHYEKAFEYYTRSLDYFKVLNDSSKINHIKLRLSDHFIKTEMYRDAEDELAKVELYYNARNNVKKLAEIQLLRTRIALEKVDYDACKTLLNQAARHLKDSMDHELRIDYLKLKTNLLFAINALDSASMVNNLCIVASDSLNFREDLGECYYQKGLIHKKKAETDSSTIAFLTCDSLLSQYPYSEIRLHTYGELIENYEQLEDFSNAYKYAKTYSLLQDSILNEGRIRAINNLTYKYETREKETEIRILQKEKAFAQQSNNQQRRALIVLGLALGILIISTYYIIRFYNQRIESAQIIETQNKELSKQKIKKLEDDIQINSMHSMIEGQELERQRIAKDLHDSLGGLLSTIKLQIEQLNTPRTNISNNPSYNTATKLIDTAVSEVRAISQNLQPGALHKLGLVPALKDLINMYASSNNPDIHLQYFDLPDKLTNAVSLGIYRIIQEILNNAVKHSKANEIIVQLTRENEDIVILVEDDGIGFDINNLPRKGMGLENIKSRVNYLKGSIDIDSRINEGTSFLIHIPT